jgi:uncharacterized protein (DUF1810 family)
MYFDRFDICEAYWCYASDCHEGQFSKIYEIFGRLHELEFSPSMDLSFESLTDNGKDIYNNLVETKHLSGL